MISRNIITLIGLFDLDTEEGRNHARSESTIIVKALTEKQYGDWYINGRNLYMSSFLYDEWRRGPFIHPDEEDYGL